MTATAPSELAQLRDIHLPEVIGWWPIAAGWYLLTALAILLVFGLIVLLRRYHMQRRATQQALHLWATYHQDYVKNRQAHIAAAHLSELLKRVALMYFPRAEVASLQGDAWIAFLNQSSKQLDFRTVRQALLEVPYQPRVDYDVEPLFTLVRQWIHQRRGACLN